MTSSYFEGEVEPPELDLRQVIFDLDPPPKRGLAGVQCENCGRFMRNAGYRMSSNPYTGDDWWTVGECSKCGVKD